MAGVALFAVAPLMVVFDTVAFNAAVNERIFKILALMTVVALQACV